jgi:hypothetical protein
MQHTLEIITFGALFIAFCWAALQYGKPVEIIVGPVRFGAVPMHFRSTALTWHTRRERTPATTTIVARRDGFAVHQRNLHINAACGAQVTLGDMQITASPDGVVTIG